MKHYLNICLLAFLFFTSCHFLKMPSNRHKNTECQNIIDSTVVEFMQSKYIYAFELNPLDTLVNNQICSYSVSKKYGRLSVYCKNIIEFLLSDSLAFESDYTPIKQPFFPTLAFKSNKQSKISCFVSFGTEEIAFSRNDSTYITYKLNNIKEFIRLKEEILSNNILKEK